MASPVALYTGYLVLRRLVPGLPYEADYVALVLAVLVGCCGVALLPVSRLARLLIAALYLPAVGVVVLGWSLAFVCGVYGACL